MSCKELDISYDARFSCQGCTACCRNRQIPISPLELQTLEGFDWVSAAPELAGKPLFSQAPTAEAPQALTLARVDGACVFLAEDGRCLVWAHAGHDAMPLACRQFPLVFAEEPTSIVVSTSFACSSVAQHSGSPLRPQEISVRGVYAEVLGRKNRGEPSSPGGLFRVPERIVLCAEIGLDWYSYLALESALVDLLEDERYPLQKRLLATYFLVDTAVAMYGGGSRTAPHFKEWIERMQENHKRRELFERTSWQRPRGFLRQRTVVAPLIRSLERWRAAAPGKENGARRLADLRALLSGKGRIYLHSLGQELELGRMRQVGFDQDAPAASVLLSRFLVECLRRKLLLRRQNILNGTQYLLACLALVRWYSVAMATLEGKAAVDMAHLTQAIALVERAYTCDGLAAPAEAGSKSARSVLGILLGLIASPTDLVANFYRGFLSQ